MNFVRRISYFLLAAGCSLPAFAWDGPPAVIGGGLVNLAHPASYLDLFGSGSPSASSSIPWDARLRGNFLLSESATDTWQGNFKLESVQLPQAVPLGNDGFNTPTTLEGLDVGAIYNSKIDASRDWGMIASIGSDSDIPFNSFSEVDINVTLTYHRQVDPLHAWFFLLNESNNRSFAPLVPLPGLGYFVIYPESHMQVFYGLPFFFACQPAKDWNFTASYFLLTAISSELSYKVSSGKLYASFQWVPQTWLRAGRSDTNAHIIFDQKKALLGWQIDLTKSLFLSVGAGFAFDQRITEADSILSSGLVYSYLPAGAFGQVEIAHRFF